MTSDTRIGAAAAAPVVGKRRRAGSSSRAEHRFAYLFVLPALLLVGVFRIFPLFWGFYLSLTNSNGLGHADFIGAGNYLAIAQDPTFRASLVNTLLLVATLPIW